jgi:hypothetical protein
VAQLISTTEGVILLSRKAFHLSPKILSNRDVLRGLYILLVISRRLQCTQYGVFFCHMKLGNRLRSFQRRSTAAGQIHGPSNSRDQRGFRVPLRPYIQKNLQGNFVPYKPITFTDSRGRDGIALANVLSLDEDFSNLIGDGPMLANYAETVIALRLEVSFDSLYRLEEHA